MQRARSREHQVYVRLIVLLIHTQPETLIQPVIHERMGTHFFQLTTQIRYQSGLTEGETC